jgi:hypothetical protein
MIFIFFQTFLMAKNYCSNQGSQNRWEPARFDRFPVEPVQPGTWTGPVPTPKPCLQIRENGKLAGFTGKPPGFFDSWEPLAGGFVNPGSNLFFKCIRIL